MIGSRFFIAALTAVFVTATFIDLGRRSDDTEKTPVDLSHLLRIQLSVEFDGERVDFDDTIFCGSRLKGTLTSRPSRQVLPSRFRISHPTKDGGLLSFPVSWILCSLGQSAWRPGKTPENEFKAPEEYLPPILWVDSVDPEERAFGEEYVSEAGYDAPGARLKILSPMQFSIPEHPPSKQAIEAAFRAEDREHALTNPLHVTPDGYIVEFPYDEWREFLLNHESPEAAQVLSFVDKLPTEPSVIRLEAASSQVFDTFVDVFLKYFNARKVSSKNLYDYGVPRRTDQRYSLLTEKRFIRWADRVVPLSCHRDGLLRPDYAKTGIRFRRANRCANRNISYQIELEGHKVSMGSETSLSGFDVYISTKTGSLFVRTGF